MDYQLLKTNHSTAITSPKTLADFLLLSFPMVLSQLCLCLPDIICYVVLGSQGNSEAVTVYGLNWTYFNMLCFSCIVSITEVTGANCSKAFGAGNYQKMAAFFYKSMALTVAVSATFWVFSQVAEPILLIINITPDIAARAGSLIKFAYWQNVLINLNMLLQAFVVSQDIIGPLYFLNFMNILVILFFTKLFILDWNMQEVGVIWAKLIQEGVMFVILVSLIWFKAHRQTIILPSWKMIRNGVNSFLRKNFYSFLGIYGEFLAFEVNTILAAHLNSLTDMTAWITYANAFTVLYGFTLGFGIAFRTRIGQMIGEGEIKAARMKSIAYFVYVIIFGATAGVLLYSFAHHIAQLFINNDVVVPKVTSCIRLLSFASISLFSMNSFFVLFRILNMELYLFKSAAVALPIISVGTCGVLAFVADMGLNGIVIGQVICFNLLTVVFAFKTFAFEKWETLCKHDGLSESLSVE
jgi:Na+-driven multidrug efflux pump